LVVDDERRPVLARELGRGDPADREHAAVEPRSVGIERCIRNDSSALLGGGEIGHLADSACTTLWTKSRKVVAALLQTCRIFPGSLVGIGEGGGLPGMTR